MTIRAPEGAFEEVVVRQPSYFEGLATMLVDERIDAVESGDLRRHRAEFHEAESESGDGFERDRILVKTARQANRIRESQRSNLHVEPFVSHAVKPVERTVAPDPPTAPVLPVTFPRDDAPHDGHDAVALDRQLRDHAALLSRCRDGVLTPGVVTVTVSGIVAPIT